MELLISLLILFMLFILITFIYCAIILSKSVDEMQRHNEVKDAYFYLIYSIGVNYNQYKDTEYTKEVFNQIVDLAVKGNSNDDISLFYEDLETNKKYNVLMEEID